MTTVTIDLSDEERALIDKARGDSDLAAFMRSAGVSAARRMATRRAESGVSEVEHHRQRAAEAMADSLPLDEFKRMVLAHIAADAEGEVVEAAS
jgi:hypothetical protein